MVAAAPIVHHHVMTLVGRRPVHDTVSIMLQQSPNLVEQALLPCHDWLGSTFLQPICSSCAKGHFLRAVVGVVPLGLAVEAEDVVHVVGVLGILRLDPL